MVDPLPVEPPATVLAAARHLAVDEGTLAPLNGATGQTWSAGDHVLRLSTPARLDIEVAAMSAAATAVPVPSVLDRTDLGNGTGAVLTTRLPGRPAGDLADLRDLDGLRGLRLARGRGRACGRLHAALAGVTAPPAVPAAPGDPGAHGRRLLHLDLHFLNVLVGDDNEVTGVLDWANTGAGEPALDRARTWTILRHDPSVVAGLAELAAAGDGTLAAFIDGWVEEAGLDGLPDAEPGAVAWACRFMLRDLAGRHRPDELAHVTREADRAAALQAVRRAP
jgi:aminoglycoside phosphotransferase (APT) family kinase protein